MTFGNGFLVVFAMILLSFVSGLCFLWYHRLRFVFTTTRVFHTYTERLEAIRDSVDEGQVITSQFQKGSEVAAKCFSDPRVSHINMDPVLAVVFAEAIGEYIDALQWCEGSYDFAEDGRARVGWKKIVEPLIRTSK